MLDEAHGRAFDVQDVEYILLVLLRRMRIRVGEGIDAFSSNHVFSPGTIEFIYRCRMCRLKRH